MGPAYRHVTLTARPYWLLDKPYIIKYTSEFKVVSLLATDPPLSVGQCHHQWPWVEVALVAKRTIPLPMALGRGSFSCRETDTEQVWIFIMVQLLYMYRYAPVKSQGI